MSSEQDPVPAPPNLPGLLLGGSPSSGGRVREPQQGQDPPARASMTLQSSLGGPATSPTFLSTWARAPAIHASIPTALPSASALLPGLHRAARRDRLLSMPCSLHFALPPLPSSSHGEFPSSSVISSIIANANNNQHGLLPSELKQLYSHHHHASVTPRGRQGAALPHPTPGSREVNSRQGMGVNPGALSQAQTPSTSILSCRNPLGWRSGAGFIQSSHHITWEAWQEFFPCSQSGFFSAGIVAPQINSMDSREFFLFFLAK